MPNQRSSHFLYLVGRLKAGVPVERATTDLEAMLAQWRTLSGGKHAPALSHIDQFINGQKIRIEKQRQLVRELMGEAERLQEILIEAAKGRKTLEKLRERRYSEFRTIRKKAELKAIDEIVVTRYGRKND